MISPVASVWTQIAPPVTFQWSKLSDVCIIFQSPQFYSCYKWCAIVCVNQTDLYIVQWRYVNDLHEHEIGCIECSDCIPVVRSQKKIKLRCHISAIIISIHKNRADEILRASCDAYFVAVPFSFREASKPPQLSLIVSVELFRCYYPNHTSIYEICIRNVIYG